VLIGTRKSPLAMAQSRWVADALCALHPGLRGELVPIITGGDRYFGPLHEVGGKGLFTAELESALREGAIDLAVHSAKDLPAAMSADLAIVAVPAREDPRDALVTVSGATIQSLPAGAVVGTSSPRRGAQIRVMRPEIQIVPLRGNVDTRLRKVLEEAQVDATVLAMAGLIRAGLLEKNRTHICPLNVEEFIPAAGQGALAIEAAVANRRATDLAAAMDDEPSRQALEAERQVVAHLDADCRSSLAVHVRLVPQRADQQARQQFLGNDGGQAGSNVGLPVGAARPFKREDLGHQDPGEWEATLWASRPDGGSPYRRTLRAATAILAAQELIRLCQAQGVRELLKG
jgi:hydroxymethylbilane synthase